MDKIFISYRREDSEGFARSLYQSLAGRFGQDQLFMDVEAIGLGMDFVEAIDSSLADCGALLVLIGKDWLDCTDAAGQRRLGKTDDFVRTEVAKAIERNVRVIPVLVKGAPMPKPDKLPEELQSLVRRQALELRHERWDHDVDHLATSLEKALGLKRIDHSRPAAGAAEGPQAPAPAKPGRAKPLAMAGVVLAAVLIVGIFIYQNSMDKPPAILETKKTATQAPTPAPVPKALATPAPAAKQAATPAPAPVPVHKTAPVPERKPAPAPAPVRTPSRITSLTGLWIDDDGAQVNIVQTGTTAVSQGIDPATGVLIKANWRLNGRNVDFNWMAASGSQGYGRGIISEDFNVVQYEFVDYLTGIQDTGRLIRSSR